MTVVDLMTATATGAELEPEVSDGLAAHQRDHAERSALQLDLGHHVVAS